MQSLSVERSPLTSPGLSLNSPVPLPISRELLTLKAVGKEVEGEKEKISCCLFSLFV